MNRPLVKVGNILESDAQTLVNTVNCVGVMGKGIALQFKRRFPDMFEDYVRRCSRHEVRLGRPYLYRQLWGQSILNFPTKDHWRSVSKLSDIVEGLEYLKRHYREWGVSSLAVPPLGCGEGQLEWRVVGPTLYRRLADFEIPVELFAPHGTPDEQLTETFLGNVIEAVVDNHRDLPATRIQPSDIALVEIIARLNSARFRSMVGRTIVQKVAFVATFAGLPSGLTFSRGSYGPFSPQLKPLLSRLENNGLLVEERRGRMFAARPGPTYRDALKVYGDQIDSWEPIIDRVADLFLRVDTREAEIAATAIYAARELEGNLGQPPTEIDVLRSVMQWKERRKPPLEESEVAEAIRHLNMLRWIRVIFSHDLPISDELAAV